MAENRLNKQKKSKKKKIIIEHIDYKDTANLRKFINRQGRIVHHKQTLLIAKNQRKVVQAIKRARQMALLPYMIVEQ